MINYCHCNHTRSQKAPIRFIVKTVADVFGVPVPKMMVRTRHSKFIQPRQLTYLLCHELTEHSMNNIGRLLNRDRTTILHGINRARGMIASDPELRLAFEQCRDRINDHFSYQGRARVISDRWWAMEMAEFKRGRELRLVAA